MALQGYYRTHLSRLFMTLRRGFVVVSALEPILQVVRRSASRFTFLLIVHRVEQRPKKEKPTFYCQRRSHDQICQLSESLGKGSSERRDQLKDRAAGLITSFSSQREKKTSLPC